MLYQIPFALIHSDFQVFLTVHTRRILPCCFCRNFRITRNNHIHQTTYRFDTQRQGCYINQQNIALIARQYIGLNRCTQRHYFIRIDAVKNRSAEKGSNTFLHQRHTRRTTDHYNRLNIRCLQFRISQSLFARCNRSFNQ